MASKHSSKFNSYATEVANYFIEELEKGVSPWTQAWDKAQNEPQNAVTGNFYRSTNFLLLAAVQQKQGYEDNRWITFLQAKALNGNIKKGEHGIPCVFWKRFENEEKVKNENGIETTEVVERFIPCPFRVFNVEQCENLTIPPLTRIEHEWTAIEAAEKILKASKANIEERYQSKAYYSVAKDKIVLPTRGQFLDAEEFYSTALHELSHWTGHESRLNRLTAVDHFGSESYAKEELRAEISSYMICSSLKLKNDTSRNTAYIQNWIQSLKNDPREIFRACSDAEKIRDYIFGLDKSLELYQGSSSEISKYDDRSNTNRAVQHFVSLSQEQKNIVVKEVAAKFKERQPLANPYQLDLFDSQVKTKSKDIER